MATTSTTALPVEDPYRLTVDNVKEPPRGWLQSLRYLGPGLIMTASIVGSGELIATTTLGAQAGFVLLWMVVVSTIVKVAVQIELARWTISTGQPAITGFNRVPPRVGRVGWVSAFWVVLTISKTLQAGAILGGTAAAFSLLLPIGGEPLGTTSTTIWTFIVMGLTIGMLYSNRYRLIERGAFYLVVLFALFTVLIAFGLPITPFGYGPDDLLGGFTFQLPAGVVGAAVAMFGITGVGADEITAYTYWCLEKGYARWSGPPDGSEAWVERARGWIKVMYKDAFMSWIIYTFCTIAFFIMGAAVLHPQRLVPKEDDMLTTLSRMYTDSIGEWAMIAFLIGTIAVLGSTLWAAVPSAARRDTDFLSTIGVLNFSDPVARMRWFKILTVVLPILWGTVFLIVAEPVLMVQIGGVMTGIFLLGVLAATWYLRQKEVDRRLFGGRLFNTLLVISSVAIALLGVYTVTSVFGLEVS